MIDHQAKDNSLFDMIRHTIKKDNGLAVEVAYSDNAAVLQGMAINHFFINPIKFPYQHQLIDMDQILKVKTHNHPTAISPYPGAATGSGGEICD